MLSSFLLFTFLFDNGEGEKQLIKPKFVELFLSVHRSYQQMLLRTLHPLYRQLSLARRATIVTAFQVQKFLRLAPPEVFGAAPAGMLAHTPLYVCGNPGIESFVRAENDIDMPIHVL